MPDREDDAPATYRVVVTSAPARSQRLLPPRIVEPLVDLTGQYPVDNEVIRRARNHFVAMAQRRLDEHQS